MKHLFLTSKASTVIQDLVTHIPGDVKGMQLVFIYTASEAEKGDKTWLKHDRDALLTVGFTITDYTISGKTESDVRRDLKDFSVIFFSGGNSFYLLKQLQLSNTASFFREQIERGVIYIGSSAGSVIAGDDIEAVKRVDTNKRSFHLQGYNGLHLVNFVIFPHWGSDTFKKLYLNHRLEHAYTLKHRLILLTDRQYIEVQDDWHRIREVSGSS